ncbi:MAG: hypothetical protein O2U61_06945 [Candidatus Bathyarchaeota archaeon]|nr:hypothetical protein [Candidatus Bathyarchaeota archaeon]
MFSKDKYNRQNIENHAQEKIQQLKEIEDFKRLKNDLFSSESYSKKLTDFLKAELLKEYNENIIEKIFKILEVKIENRNKTVEVENYSRVIRKNKEYISTNEYRMLNNTSGKLPIGKYVRKTFNKLVGDRKIDNHEVEKMQRHDYSKATFDIQFSFLAKEN